MLHGFCAEGVQGLQGSGKRAWDGLGEISVRTRAVRIPELILRFFSCSHHQLSRNRPASASASCRAPSLPWSSSWHSGETAHPGCRFSTVSLQLIRLARAIRGVCSEGLWTYGFFHGLKSLGSRSVPRRVPCPMPVPQPVPLSFFPVWCPCPRSTC